jgi:hypothetical protein
MGQMHVLESLSMGQLFNDEVFDTPVGRVEDPLADQVGFEN